MRGRLLGGDELIEPPHLSFGSLETVLLELEGVGIDTLTTACHRLAQECDSLLETRPAAMKDSHSSPRLRP